MFFVLSKIFGFVIVPSNFLALLAMVAAILLFTRYMRFGRILAATAALGYFLCAFGPLGAFLAWPLENRFPRPTNLHPSGIIVLGGALDSAIALARGGQELMRALRRLQRA